MPKHYGGTIMRLGRERDSMTEDKRKPRAVSVREDTDHLIEAIARKFGCTKAGVVRQAVELLAQSALPNPDFRKKETR
jgi:transposase-like protein